MDLFAGITPGSSFLPLCMSAPDPLNLDDTTRELRDKVQQIHDVSGASAEPPPIPELLTKPVERPASLHPKAPGPLAGLGELGKSLALGLDFLFMSAAGGAVGYLFDRWKGSFPVGTVIGAGVGFLMGTFRLIRRISK